jgi:hypothetical protein
MSFVIGSIISINREYYIASKLSNSGWNLINLKNGEKFSTSNYPINSDSRTVTNASLSQFLDHFNIEGDRFKVMSTSLESLIKQNKKKSKANKAPAPRDYIQEFINSMRENYDDLILDDGEILYDALNVTFRMLDSGSTRQLTQDVYSNVPGARIHVGGDGTTTISLPVVAIRGIVSGDYGRVRG